MGPSPRPQVAFCADPDEKQITTAQLPPALPSSSLLRKPLPSLTSASSSFCTVFSLSESWLSEEFYTISPSEPVSISLTANRGPSRQQLALAIPHYLRPPAPKHCGELRNKSSVMPLRSPTLSNNYEPVSPVDITANPKRTRSVGFAPQPDDKDDTKVTTRSIRTNSSSSITLNNPRKARFAEATSVLSPASGPGEHKSPFRDPKMAEDGPKPSDVGFGYIADNEPREQYATIRPDNSAATGQPLKSALKTPGTASRLLNPLSPTFREEVQLEKQEESTEKEQAKDLVSGFMHYPSTTVTDNHSRKSRPEYAWPRCSFAVSTSPAR